MRKFLLSVTLATLVITPAQAADWQNQAMDMRPGVFVGARMQLSLGGKTPAPPRAALTLSPTVNRISSSGMVRTSIGEGLALNFSPQSKPTLTLAGVRADTALGLQRQGQFDGDQKQGISKTGWIAIGAVTVAVVGGTLLFLGGIDCAQADDPCES